MDDKFASYQYPLHSINAYVNPNNPTTLGIVFGIAKKLAIKTATVILICSTRQNFLAEKILLFSLFWAASRSGPPKVG